MNIHPLSRSIGQSPDTKPLPPIFPARTTGHSPDTKPLPPIFPEAGSPDRLALIIEDDLGLAVTLADALRTLDFETEVATDGKEALSLLDETVPGIVVLDLHLPVAPDTRSLRHTGMGVLHELQSDPRLTDTCIIIATGDARAAEQLSEQVDLVLLKPFSYSQLQDLVARMGGSGNTGRMW